MSFTVCNFNNTQPMKVIFFFKLLKLLLLHIYKMERTIDKTFLAFQIIAFYIVPADPKHSEDKSCHWQSIFQQRVVTVEISITEKLSKPVFSSILIKVLSSRFHKCFGPFNMLILEECLSMPFTICNFENRPVTRVTLFFKKS